MKTVSRKYAKIMGVINVDMLVWSILVCCALISSSTVLINLVITQKRSFKQAEGSLLVIFVDVYLVLSYLMKLAQKLSPLRRIKCLVNYCFYLNVIFIILYITLNIAEEVDISFCIVLFIIYPFLTQKGSKTAFLLTFFTLAL